MNEISNFITGNIPEKYLRNTQPVNIFINPKLILNKVAREN